MENINITQDDTIYENKSSALVKLNITQISPGELLSIRYYNDLSYNSIDTLLALGVGNETGQGPSYYSIISESTNLIVQDILYNQWPDTSEVYKGEVYFVVIEEGQTIETNPDVLDVDIDLDVETIKRFYYATIGEDEHGMKYISKIVPVEFFTYFTSLKDKKFYLVEPINGLLVDITRGQLGYDTLDARLKKLEEAVTVTVKVNDTKLIFL